MADVEERIKPVYPTIIYYSQITEFLFCLLVQFQVFEEQIQKWATKSYTYAWNKLEKVYTRVPPCLTYTKVLSTRKLRASGVISRCMFADGGSLCLKALLQSKI